MKTLRVLLFIIVATLNAQSPKADAKDSQKYTYLANKKLAEKRATDAEVDYRTAISKDNTNTVPKYNLGNMYYGSENYDEAIHRYQQAAKIAKTKAEKHSAYHNLGNSLMRKEDYKLAVEAYKNALINDPKDEETRYNYALAKELSKKENKNPDNKEKDQKNKDGGGSDDKNKDQQNNENDKKDQQNKDKQNDDKGDKNKNDNPNKNNKENNPQQQQQQQSPSQLSPEQVENLLEAVNSEERKVQNKIDGQKVNTGDTKQEKDW